MEDTTKLLIIEDDVTMADLYKRVLEKEGFSVTSVYNGEAGLNSAKAQKFSVIILDIMMPKMDGLQVLKTLKSDPETSGVPVIILTNLGNETVLQEALTLGAVEYIVKSDVTNEALSDRIKKYVPTK